MVLFAMLSVTLTQVSAVGFCEGTSKIFMGQHEVLDHSKCSHSHETEAFTDCSDEQRPCEDRHLEIDIEIEDYVRTIPENDHSVSEIATSRSLYAISVVNSSYLQNLAVPSDFARPPPDLAVYLRFGVMRL